MSGYSTARNLHIDKPLSNILIGRRPEGFIADQLLPVLSVSKQSDIYFKTLHMQFRRHEANITARAPGTEARKISFSVSSDTYYAKNYALGADWPVEDQVNADEALDWAMTHTTLLADRLQMDYEVRVAGLLNTAANIATTANVSTSWILHSTAKFMDDMATQIENFRTRTGLRPNRLILPEQVAYHVRLNDQVRDHLFGDRGGMVEDNDIARLLKIEKVLVPSVLVNTTGDTETINGSGSLANVWGNYAYLGYVNPLPGKIVDTWAQAFRWTSPLFGSPMAIQRYPFDEKKKVYGIEASYYQDEKIVSADLFMRIESVVG
jgi:hypothetical protein